MLEDTKTYHVARWYVQLVRATERELSRTSIKHPGYVSVVVNGNLLQG